ncbi:MAG: TrmH family RNA methyltransferase [Candidatus Kaiserbacteria bacterium]|nr:TrmH family RNA methyltransferase [Candidatus Kaiserbacteria bacterium]
MRRYVIIHNIRSAHNVGSIFRTSDGAGVSKIFITGYTPAPTDRFGRENAEIAKTSLGATHTVPYEIEEDITVVIKNLKEEGVQIIAVEQTERAIEYTKFEQVGDVAFIFGNEITGVEEEVLKVSDAHIQIPMSGVKESLNVSVCAGIVLFHFRDVVAVSS